MKRDFENSAQSLPERVPLKTEWRNGQSRIEWLREQMDIKHTNASALYHSMDNPPDTLTSELKKMMV